MLLYVGGVEPGFERRAAEATLLALEEVIPNREPGFPFAYYWLPNIAPATREQVIDSLVRAPKRVRCLASNLSGGLAIGVWPLFRDAEGSPGVFEREARGIAEDLPVPGAGSEQMMLLGNSGSVRLTAREFRIWQLAYDLPGVTLRHGEDGDARARRYGVEWVTEFEPTVVERGGNSGGIVFDARRVALSDDDLQSVPEWVRKQLRELDR